MIHDDLMPEAAPRAPDDLVPRTVDETHAPLLGAARAVLRAVTWLSPLPVGRHRLFWVLPRPVGHAVADAYVVTWVGALVACLAIADGDAGPVVAGVALFRAGDLVLTQAVVLLDPVGPRLGDARRALLLVGLHVVEVVLVVATVFRWIVGERLGSAFVTGLDVVTFQWPARHAGNWIEAVRGVAAFAVMLLLVRAVVSAVRVARER